jgi:hypothetical protein
VVILQYCFLKDQYHEISFKTIQTEITYGFLFFNLIFSPNATTLKFLVTVAVLRRGPAAAASAGTISTALADKAV